MVFLFFALDLATYFVFLRILEIHILENSEEFMDNLGVKVGAVVVDDVLEGAERAAGARTGSGTGSGPVLAGPLVMFLFFASDLATDFDFLRILENSEEFMENLGVMVGAVLVNDVA